MHREPAHQVTIIYQYFHQPFVPAVVRDRPFFLQTPKTPGVHFDMQIRRNERLCLRNQGIEFIVCEPESFGPANAAT
ncbi:hypothetical protein D3C87_1680700 [compost metagenome]